MASTRRSPQSLNTPGANSNPFHDARNDPPAAHERVLVTLTNGRTTVSCWDGHVWNCDLRRKTIKAVKWQEIQYEKPADIETYHRSCDKTPEEGATVAALLPNWRPVVVTWTKKQWWGEGKAQEVVYWRPNCLHQAGDIFVSI